MFLQILSQNNAGLHLLPEVILKSKKTFLMFFVMVFVISCSSEMSWQEKEAKKTSNSSSAFSRIGNSDKFSQKLLSELD